MKEDYMKIKNLKIISNSSNPFFCLLFQLEAKVFREK